MGKIPSNKIEDWSINNLRSILEKSEYIKTDIKSNDKTPSWDGEIYLYNSIEQKKENLEVRIPIQVKGKAVTREKLKEKITYSVEISDLKNYQKEGGIIYFVVYILNAEEYKIYYNVLLSYELKRILGKLEKNQKRKSIEFKSFPNDISKMETIFKYFGVHRRKQISTAEAEKLDLLDLNNLERNIKDLKNIPKISFVTSFKDIFDIETYLYAERYSGIYSPIGKIKIKEFTLNDTNLNIFIDDKKIEGTTSVTISKNNEEFCLYNCVYIKTKSELEGIMKLERKSILQDYINGLVFYKMLCTAKSLKIGNIIECTNLNIHDDVEAIAKDIDFYRKIQTLLNTLKVNKPLRVDTISENDLNNLYNLYLYIVEGKRFKLKKKQGIEHKIYGFGNLNIAVLFSCTEDGYCSYSNFFDEKYIDSKGYIINEGKHFKISPYVLLKKDYFLKISNVNYSVIGKAIMSKKYEKGYGSFINTLALELLAVYDEVKRQEILNIAVDILEWLKNNDKEIYYILNYYQAISRKRNLNIEEVAELKSLQKKEDNDVILLGISIILKNTTDIEYYLNILDKKQRDEFMKYPIVNLIENDIK